MLAVFKMNILLLYPLFPKGFWSFEKTLALLDQKAMLPQEWKFKLVGRNVCSVTEVEWAWADLVILSAMTV